MRVTFHGTLLAVILIVLAMMAIGPARQWYQEEQTIRAGQSTLAAGNAEAGRLNAKLKDLQDPSYVEAIARGELGYVAPGETSYVVSQPQQQPPTLGQVGPSASSAEVHRPSPSLLTKIRLGLTYGPLP